MCKSMVSSNGVKIEVGMVVRVNRGCHHTIGTVSFNSKMREYEGTTQVVHSICSRGVRLVGVESRGCHWVWDTSWLTVVCQEENQGMTKEEWLIELMKGKIGIQSGNTSRRYSYSYGKLRGKYPSEAEWDLADINNIHSDRVFTIVKDTEMTIAQIEEKLGVTNLKIIK